MRDQVDIFPTHPVNIMAELMESRMCEHNHWSGWDNMSRNELASRILKNLSGILDAKREVNSKEYDLAFEKYIRDQSADIANFAMMLALNLGKLKEIKKMTENRATQIEPGKDIKMSDSEKSIGDNVESIEEQAAKKIDQMIDQTVNPEYDPQTKGTPETEEANTDELKKAVDLLELRRELEETFDAYAITRLKRILAEYPEDVDKSWESPPIGLSTAGADEPVAPYQHTMERLDTILELANEVIVRLDPVLAGEGTVSPVVDQDTITQVDGKLASIHLTLSNLHHRIQL